MGISRTILSSTFVFLLAVSQITFAATDEVRFDYEKVTGIGQEEGVCRRDPSDVIKVGDTWYVWYSKVTSDAPMYPSGYHATVWYATSTDEGHTWTERGEAVGGGKWNARGVARLVGRRGSQVVLLHRKGQHRLSHRHLAGAAVGLRRREIQSAV